MRRILFITVFAIACFSEVEYKSFNMDKLYIGPNIGFVNFGQSLSAGFSLEYPVVPAIGITADLAVASFEDHWSRYDIDYSFIGLLVGGAYHFRPDEQLDPFAKFSLGYFDFSYEEPFEGSPYDAVYGNRLGYGFQLGLRYMLSERLALKTGLGFPFYFTAGIDFALDMGSSNN